MNVTVKLFGTLDREVDDYDHTTGLFLDLPDGATVADLLARLEILEAKKVAVTVDATIMKPADRLKDGALVHILQVAHGG